MNIEITSRSPGIPDALREYGESRLSGIERFGEQFEKGEIFLTQEHDDLVCEVVLHRQRGEALTARAEAKDGKAAVDTATERLERQFVRFKEMHSHKGRRQRAS